MHNLNDKQSHHLYTYTNLKIHQKKEDKGYKAHPCGQFYHGDLEKTVTFKSYNQLNKIIKTYKNWKEFSLSSYHFK